MGSLAIQNGRGLANAACWDFSIIYDIKERSIFYEKQFSELGFEYLGKFFI